MSDEKDSVTQEVLDIISKKLEKPVEALQAEKTFVELGADSLDQADLLMDIEEKFNVSIPEEESAEIKTIGDAIKCVKEHIGGGA